MLQVSEISLESSLGKRQGEKKVEDCKAMVWMGLIVLYRPTEGLDKPLSISGEKHLGVVIGRACGRFSESGEYLLRSL